MEIISHILQVLVDFSSSIGYWGIFMLMTIESSFVPFPSELVIPPAAFLAAKGEMNIFLVILFGVLGSLAGAVINYYLALLLGQPVIYKLIKSKWAKIFLLSEKKLQKAENYFLKYGNISTFFGRLVFVVRQLISLPAGFVKMPLKSFVFYTFLGSSIWVTILAINGYMIGKHQNFFSEHLNKITLLGFTLFALGLSVYVYLKKIRKSVVVPEKID